jgi:hypothetical protein
MSNGSSFLLRGTAIAGVIASVVAVVGTSVSGCGGIGPGDYVIYRVSYGELSRSSGCYPDKEVPADEKSDSTTYRTGTSFILYAGAEDAFYLDTGEKTLQGTKSSDTYAFAGKAVDVEYSNPNGTGAKTTVTVTATVDMTVDGEAVSGKVTTKTTQKCTGSDACPDDFSCTESVDFVGMEVEDVQLFHEADEGGEGGPDPIVPPDPQGSSSTGFGGSGGSGGFGASSSSSSSSSSSGTGGAGCLTCSTWFEGVPGTICEQSFTYVQDVFTCACSFACADTGCFNTCSNGMMDSSCSSCVSSDFDCQSQFAACVDDF